MKAPTMPVPYPALYEGAGYRGRAMIESYFCHGPVGADLTESSHTRLAEIACRSADGFRWNGDGEPARA
ncbi:hypothetical protein VTH06DRAFT_913 [Thermothelomyces fergusii]